MPNKLSEHEGRDVNQSTIRISGAGTGLNDALNIDPAEYRIGDTVHVVLETKCARVAYEQIGDLDVERRVHTLKTVTGTIVTRDAVADVLDAHVIAVEKAHGIERLPLSDDDE